MKATRTILQCTVTRNDGSVFSNPLMKSEAHLISKMARENKSVLVTEEEVTTGYYNLTFGTSHADPAKKFAEKQK